MTPPERPGFGTTLLRVAIGGADPAPRIDYAPEGLSYTLTAPFAAVAVKGVEW